MCSSFSLFAMLAIVMACYATSGSTTPLQARIARAALMKKVDLPHQRKSSPAAASTHPLSLSIAAQQQQEQQQQEQHYGEQSPPVVGRHTSQTSNEKEMRRKRSQHDIAEYKELNDILDDLEATSTNDAPAKAAPSAAAAQQGAFGLETITPLAYYLLLQKLIELQTNEPTYRVRTPRLGRSIDFQLFDTAGAAAAPATSVGVASTGLYGGGVGGGGVGGGGGNIEGILAGDIDGEDFQRLDIGVPARQFLLSRLVNKKSVPFKPRLGKRARQQAQALTCN